MQSASTEEGRLLRKKISRSSYAELKLPEQRDPVAVLEAQHESRLEDLIPVRIGRMLQSPFAYYRGTAAVMAADLAKSQATGIEVVSCGDAHISNFGFFASPERSLLFDLNDFDEAGVAPWEWDVKRLAASVHIGGRDIGLSEAACKEASARAVGAYRKTLKQLRNMTALERYFYTVNTEHVEQELATAGGAKARKAAKKARTRTSQQVLEKVATRAEDGSLRIVDQPPVTRHVDHASLEQMDDVFERYLSNLREDTAYLLSQFKMVDYVLRVVGVGSVGTRCYVLAFEGPTGEVLFLQAKEAQESVLSNYGGLKVTIPGYSGSLPYSEGHRVVACQRILQAQSDPFLGHMIGFAGEKRKRDISRVDYYWRQFRDMKGSIDPATLDGDQFAAYSSLCARLLARAHSQSPGIAAISSYLGSSDSFDLAIADWAAAYADVCEADFAALENAVSSGRMPAEFNS